MNVGVIGLGKMGILHAGILSAIPSCQLKAICEKEGLLVKAAKGFLGKTFPIYTDYMDMLEKEDLQAVFVTTPIHTHVPIITDVARSGSDVSVFVEKPLASTYREAQSACDAVRNWRGVHMVGYQKRFSPVFQRAREYLGDRLLGDLLFFRAYSFSSDVLRRGNSWRFRRGTGGVLLDLAPHVLDLLLWFFGEPAEVRSMSRRIFSDEVEDYFHVDMSYDGGSKGTLDTCWCIRNFRLPEISIEVYGKKGIMIVSDDFVKLALGRGLGKNQTLYRQSFDNSVSFLLADREYTMEDDAFATALQGGSKPQSNFFEAAKVNAIIDRINENVQETE